MTKEECEMTFILLDWEHNPHFRHYNKGVHTFLFVVEENQSIFGENNLIVYKNFNELGRIGHRPKWRNFTNYKAAIEFAKTL